ncbi:hypothetical protein ACFWMJ_41010 [Streptomyces hawaiiensis]|uniref:hypothetical protein n=1 Tax=Streptomyces hawaiiensis TaxID=67305 RepID=UPI00364E5CFB
MPEYISVVDALGQMAVRVSPAMSGTAGMPRSAVPLAYLKDRRRRLLVATKTDEKAIAAPAIIGLSMLAAASGSAATLEPNAQKRCTPPLPDAPSPEVIEIERGGRLRRPVWIAP